MGASSSVKSSSDPSPLQHFLARIELVDACDLAPADCQRLRHLCECQRLMTMLVGMDRHRLHGQREARRAMVCSYDAEDRLRMDQVQQCRVCLFLPFLRFRPSTAQLSRVLWKELKLCRVPLTDEAMSTRGAFLIEYLSIGDALAEPPKFSAVSFLQWTPLRVLMRDYGLTAQTVHALLHLEEENSFIVALRYGARATQIVSAPLTLLAPGSPQPPSPTATEEASHSQRAVIDTLSLARKRICMQCGSDTVDSSETASVAVELMQLLLFPHKTESIKSFMSAGLRLDSLPAELELDDSLEHGKRQQLLEMRGEFATAWNALKWHGSDAVLNGAALCRATLLKASACFGSLCSYQMAVQCSVAAHAELASILSRLHASKDM